MRGVASRRQATAREVSPSRRMATATGVVSGVAGMPSTVEVGGGVIRAVGAGVGVGVGVGAGAAAPILPRSSPAG